MRPRSMVALAAGAGAAVTVAVATSPRLHFAYDRQDLHLVLETTEGLIAMLVVYLLVGRLRATRRLSDALLVYALVVLGATNLISAIPAAVAGRSIQTLETWGPLWTRVLGAVAFCAAAMVPADRIVRGSVGGRVVRAATATFALGIALGYVVTPQMPELLASVSPRQDLLHPFSSGHPLVYAAQLGSALLFATAAVGFVRKAERTGDELMTWIAVSATLSAFSRANYFLFPSLYSDYVYTGDVLRLASYLFLLFGASREIRTYWERTAALAAEQERRRMARDLHDGLAQELNFITTSTKRLRTTTDPEATRVQVERIASAGQRALDESRRAIDHLQAPATEPVQTLLPWAAEQVAGRAGARVRCDVDEDLEVSPEVAEQLVRIVREAVTNATRHGGADFVELRLVGGQEMVLTLADNGKGFDADAAANGHRGFGLISMRERAEAMGGVFGLRSAPGEGTTVEVRIPSTT